jgi:hypothetical protein
MLTLFFQLLANARRRKNIIHTIHTEEEVVVSQAAKQEAIFQHFLKHTTVTPVGQIFLPVTFGTHENFFTETIQFEVVNFEIAYNAFLGLPALSKFMAIPHCAYLVLKMAGPRGVISIRGDIKQDFDYDRERCKTADRLTASIELQ